MSTLHLVWLRVNPPSGRRCLSFLPAMFPAKSLLHRAISARPMAMRPPLPTPHGDAASSAPCGPCSAVAWAEQKGPVERPGEAAIRVNGAVRVKGVKGPGGTGRKRPGRVTAVWTEQTEDSGRPRKVVGSMSLCWKDTQEETSTWNRTAWTRLEDDFPLQPDVVFRFHVKFPVCTMHSFLPGLRLTLCTLCDLQRVAALRVAWEL